MGIATQYVLFMYPPQQNNFQLYVRARELIWADAASNGCLPIHRIVNKSTNHILQINSLLIICFYLDLLTIYPFLCQ